MKKMKYEYTITVGSYGGELCIGDVPSNFLDYWYDKLRELYINEKGNYEVLHEYHELLSDYLWNEQWDDEHDSVKSVPESCRLEIPWHDVNNICHLNAPFIDGGILEIREVNNLTEEITINLHDEDWSKDNRIIEDLNEELESECNGTLVTMQIDKGVYVWDNLELDTPFDLKQLQLESTKVDEDLFLTSISYMGEELYTQGSEGLMKDFIARTLFHPEYVKKRELIRKSDCSDKNRVAIHVQCDEENSEEVIDKLKELIREQMKEEEGV